MKLVSKLLALVAAFFFAAPAMAATDCTTTIRWMHVEVGGVNTVAYLTTGAQFYIYATDANVKALMSIAELAMTAGHTVTARFSNNGVSCTSAATIRTDLLTLYTYGPTGQ